MAPSLAFFHIHLIFLSLHLLPTSESSLFKGFTSIISFGDSLADTGNLIYSQPETHAGKCPYGETFFHHPTGRFSDGRLIIDFFAEEMGIPYLPPYLPAAGKSVDVKRGINFAVSGATAMAAEFFAERGIAVGTNYSLGEQIRWFQRILPSLCPAAATRDCKDELRSTIFMVGEIGGNDFNDPFFQGWRMDRLEGFIPQVTKEIELALETLIKHGATTMVVPGNFPIGCATIYLTAFRSSNREDYDDSNCLIEFNNFAKRQNQQLTLMLEKLRQRHPYATILYADYYNAAKPIYDFRRVNGFGEGKLRACCGTGEGPYNFNASAQCGESAMTKVCKDPSSYINWDGIHFTEAAYRRIAKTLMFRLKAALDQPISSEHENDDEVTWQ